MLFYTLHQIINDHARRRAVHLTSVDGLAPDPWQVDITFTLTGCEYLVRSLAEGDEVALITFGHGLGAVARDKFGPYPWADTEACTAAFRHAVLQSVKRIDASYLLFRSGEPIGHFFLWKAGGNPVSRLAGLEVPELGVAIADAFTGQGFGSLAVRLLVAIAAELGADAVELTTATDNEQGWRTYSNVGFTYTGMLRIPVGVDVTAFEAGEVTASSFREERQMVYVLRPDRAEAIHAFLASKRGLGAGRPSKRCAGDQLR